ncbi:MAG: hypothetical protein JW395_0084 [Nitrospira sp.]|nr:hypothetical protein [Nitrospira sp.]
MGENSTQFGCEGVRGRPAWAIGWRAIDCWLWPSDIGGGSLLQCSQKGLRKVPHRLAAEIVQTQQMRQVEGPEVSNSLDFFLHKNVSYSHRRVNCVNWPFGKPRRRRFGNLAWVIESITNQERISENARQTTDVRREDFFSFLIGPLIKDAGMGHGLADMRMLRAKAQNPARGRFRGCRD